MTFTDPSAFTTEQGEETRRLWQQNSPATPESSAAFGEESLKNSLFRYIYLNQALT